MEQNNGNKYSTYILELVRNNGITNANEKEIDEKGKDGEVSHQFLLFDYFDTLYCKELCGDDKKYLNYLSIENVFEDTIHHSQSYKVSYKTLSLYCKANNEQTNSGEKSFNIFSISGTEESLSDTPFLGLIQISLCKDNYVKQNDEDINEKDIDNFLVKCESGILEIANKHIGTCARMQLFRSSTTGDFCLVVRTDSIKAIYNIAMALNGTQNNPDEKIKMLTFTNVGIECKYLEGKGYATLSEKFVSDHSGIIIALRFSADELLKQALQEYIKNKQSANNNYIRGLFGRYEYLLYIDLDEFAKLYPFLCEKKMGRSMQGREASELEKCFRNSRVRNINERILVELNPEISEETNAAALSHGKENNSGKTGEDNIRDEVLCKNRGLFKEIKDLEGFKRLFHEEHFAFQDLIRGMKEIYKAFSPTGMDKESYINWCIFHKDMKVLCTCIRQMMTYYEHWVKQKDIDESDKKWYRGIVLGDWRNNLQAINRYTTLVQNVNYQTYQSPIYEIQTQIDTEKAMVAYREAMELYITGAIQAIAKEEKTDNTIVFPIIYPDLSKDRVEIAAPFMIKRPNGITTESAEFEIMQFREIICTVPSFEYFGRLYDLLPWIIHETSHHLRVTDRKERNRFVTEYIFSNIFKEVMSEPMRRLSDCEFYKTFGKAEEYLISSMAEVAEKEICEQKDFAEFNFEKLILEIDKWLKRTFPLGVGYRGKVYTREEKQLKKEMFNFWLDAFRKEEMLIGDNLDMILNILEDHDNREEKEKLAEKLLDRYYETLCVELKDKVPELKVCMNDIQDVIQMESKLAELSKVSEEKKAVVRVYCDQVIAVYRIMRINLEETDKEADHKKTEAYLREVFNLYNDKYKEKAEKNNIVVDTVSMHIMRNLGLLNGDVKTFLKEMNEIVRNVDNTQIMEHKETKQKVYLEAYADLLMATSLQLTSFGYCRQVLQTMSDAKLMDKEYNYEDINYERWRTVAAVLLVEEGANKEKVNGMIQVNAEALIENGKEYCQNIIRHITEKLSKKELSLENADEDLKKEIEEKRGLLAEFLCVMNTQIEKYIEDNETEIDNSFFLHILLQADMDNKDGNIDIKDEKMKMKWEEIKELVPLCSEYKYNFWRIDCFCRGIGNIVQKGKIRIPEKLFDHMGMIRKKANSKEVQGCFWEKRNKFLVEPKQDVGEFYNSPELVYAKSPAQKLDNTIEFIQNYYYFNRFRVVNEKWDPIIRSME